MLNYCKFLPDYFITFRLFEILDLTSPGICIDQFDYKPSLHQDILSADLVIAHAGAGTCLEGELCRDDRYKSLGTRLCFP